MQFGRQRLQGQELLQRQGRLRDRRIEVGFHCRAIVLTDSPTTALASAYAFHTTATFSSASRWWIGSRSSPRTSWWREGGPSPCSTRYSSDTAWSSTESRCTLARPSRCI